MPFILKLVFPKIFLNISFAPPFSVCCYFYRFVFIIVCRGVIEVEMGSVNVWVNGSGIWPWKGVSD